MISYYIETFLKNKKPIGAAIGFIENRKTSFFCSGKKLIHDDDPITVDTIFEIGSITKLFTTLLLTELTSKGEINMDTPVEDLLSTGRIPEFNKKKITLLHLATHSSGLPNLPSNFDPKNLLNPYIDYSIKDLYRFLNHHKLKKAPGEHFEYSNLGMSLLGHALCVKTKKNFGQLITDSILKPLSMGSTGFEVFPNMRNQMSTGHHVKQPIPLWDIPEHIRGCVGMLSSIKDMTQFLAANMGVIDSPIANLLKLGHKPQFTYNSIESIGLGWIISHHNHDQIVWHDGITGGFSSYLGFNVKTQKGIVILSNSLTDWLDELIITFLK